MSIYPPNYLPMSEPTHLPTYVYLPTHLHDPTQRSLGIGTLTQSQIPRYLCRYLHSKAYTSILKHTPSGV